MQVTSKYEDNVDGITGTCNFLQSDVFLRKQRTFVTFEFFLFLLLGAYGYSLGCSLNARLSAQPLLSPGRRHLYAIGPPEKAPFGLTITGHSMRRRGS